MFTDRKITYWDVLNMNAIRIIDGSDSADVNSLHVNAAGCAGEGSRMVVYSMSVAAPPCVLP